MNSFMGGVLAVLAVIIIGVGGYFAIGEYQKEQAIQSMKSRYLNRDRTYKNPVLNKPRLEMTGEMEILSFNCKESKGKKGIYYEAELSVKNTKEAGSFGTS